MKKLMFIATVMVLAGKAVMAQPFAGQVGEVYSRVQESLWISSYPTAATQGTVMISSPIAQSTYSSGEHIYITDIYITAYSSAGVAAVTPVQCTSENLGGWTAEFAPTYSTGVVQSYLHSYTAPMVSTSAAKQVRVTCPATSAIRWNIGVNYYSAP